MTAAKRTWATPPRISYVSEDVVPAYNRMLDAADERSALLTSMQQWGKLAPDAHAIVKQMDTSGFAEWRRGLTLERKGKFAGEDWARRYAAVLMPERLFRASIIADHFGVPWGTAWLRLQEEGLA